MEYIKCPTCKQTYWTSIAHRCLPRWEVNIKDYHCVDGWQEVYALDEGEAAEKVAEEYDCADSDYTLLRGDTIEVRVRKDEHSEVKAFVVSGRSVPMYSAREVGE